MINLVCIKVNDYQIETLAENLQEKADTIYNYYHKLLKDEKNSLEKMKFSKFFKEISCFIAILVSQIRTFRTAILKNNLNSLESEIYFVKIQKNEYSFSNFNLNSKTSNLIINYENPIFENYEKRLKVLEDDLILLTNSKKENDHLSDLDNCFSLRNTDSIAIMEKYLFKLLENSFVSFSKEDYTHAKEELILSKYLIETIIFLRLMVFSIEPINLTSEDFCKTLVECTIENTSFIFEEKKVDSQLLINGVSLFYSFLGLEMKNYIKKRAIYIEKSDKTNEEGNLIHFTRFYLDIVKMMNECDGKINQYK